MEKMARMVHKVRSDPKARNERRARRASKASKGKKATKALGSTYKNGKLVKSIKKAITYLFLLKIKRRRKSMI